LSIEDLSRQLLAGIFKWVDLHRLPELFCGFQQSHGEGPTLYPVACVPQSWAAGAVFLLLQAAMGLEIRALHGQVRLTHPMLPEFLRELRINNLQIGEAVVDLSLQRHAQNVSIGIHRREGDVEIIVVK
jgi:glycogen debranching enzyme